MKKIDQATYLHAKKLWDYHKLNHEITPMDAIIGLGGHDTRVAERSAELFLKNHAPILIFTGGVGAWRVNADVQDKTITEAARFSAIAIGMGVPKEKILLEDKSTNTGENIKFTKELISQKGHTVNKAILVNQPYMERRTYATFKAQWAELDIIVTSPQHTFDEFPTKEITIDKVIKKMVTDLERIIEYPKKGFQIPQEIPNEVMESYTKLIKMGYAESSLK